MERRKFIAGVGSLTAAGAAGIGTGAFTSVSAKRGLTVKTADDADALLGIKECENSPNSSYVEVNDDGAVTIDISTEEGGDGLNVNATTIIQDLLKITNQGKQEVYVWVSGLPDGVKFGVQTEDSEFQNAGTGAQQNQGALSLNSNLDPNDLDDSEGDGQEEAAPLLAVGDYIKVKLFSYGDNPDLDFDDTVTIHAVDADQVE